MTSMSLGTMVSLKGGIEVELPVKVQTKLVSWQASLRIYDNKTNITSQNIIQPQCKF